MRRSEERQDANASQAEAKRRAHGEVSAQLPSAAPTSLWNAPGLVDTVFVRSRYLRDCVLLFPPGGADASEAGVSAVGVVPPFDVLKHLAA